MVQKRQLWLAFFGVCCCAAVALAVMVDVRMTGTMGGIYLFRHGWRWVVSDGLFLGEENAFVVGLDLRRSPVDVDPEEEGPRPRLVYKWVTWDGTGYVRNLLPEGREIVTTFSRWVDREGRHPKGLFVGGRPPLLQGNETTRTLNRSGMAYYDGSRWFHLWCNANEGIALAGEDDVVQVFEWEHIESGVVQGSPMEVRLRSRHRVTFPARMKSLVPEGPETTGSGKAKVVEVVRTATFRSGEPYFVLNIAISNPVGEPVWLNYGYGDEPWLGEYGSSEGNVGWVADRLVLYEEELDLSREKFAGYFDFGNPAIAGAHDYTEVANFIEWHPGTPPDRAYFSNEVGLSPAEDLLIPLEGNERALTLEWGPVHLAAGQTYHILLAIGMATTDGEQGLPTKPMVVFGSPTSRGGRH